MIVGLEQFARIRERLGGIVVATSGGFDPLHGGHLRSLEGARALGDLLVVIANGDGYLLRKKGYVFMPLEDRLAVLDALRCVDYVIPFDDGSAVVAAAVRLLRPAIFAKGVTLARPEELPEWDACREAGCRVVLGVGGPKSRSSSELARAAASVAGRPPQCSPQKAR